MKLSFKKHKKETGLAGIGYPYPPTDVKIDGKRVGLIIGPNWTSSNDLWKIQIAVNKTDINEDGNPNCPWRYVFIKGSFSDEPVARNYLITHKEDIFKLNLHYFTD